MSARACNFEVVSGGAVVMTLDEDQISPSTSSGSRQTAVPLHVGAEKSKSYVSCCVVLLSCLESNRAHLSAFEVTKGNEESAQVSAHDLSSLVPLCSFSLTLHLGLCKYLLGDSCWREKSCGGSHCRTVLTNRTLNVL